mgnify:CR=1 FL=1
MPNKNRNAADSYTSITVTKDGKKEFAKLHKDLGAGFTVMGFFAHIVSCYRKSCCPECGKFLNTRRCNCKDS